MNLNKLARWASVTAFSTIIPAAAMAKAHHTRPTTAPSALTARHVKATPAKKTVASKLKTRSVKPAMKGSKALTSTKHKSVGLKSKKGTASKLIAGKHSVSKKTAKKTVSSKLATGKRSTSKLTTTKAKAHMLSSHKLAAKRAVKPATPVTPTM
jgi:hypothetical protein